MKYRPYTTDVLFQNIFYVDGGKGRIAPIAPPLYLPLFFLPNHTLI